jgi:hypothetical protein
MTQRLLIFLTVLLLIACETKQKRGQWNLNETLGWEPGNPDDFTVLFVKWNRIDGSSDHISDKKKFDEAVLKELQAKGIGNRAENDEKTETDLHFVVSKDYQKAIVIILSLAKTYSVEQQITVYQRDYQDLDKWTDKKVYPD